MANDEIDRDLLTRLAAGDTASFDLLIARHQPTVTRQARRLLAWRTDVDDVVQEVFLALWRGHGRFRGDSALSTWLITVTIRECRRKLRREFLRNRLFGQLCIVAERTGDSSTVVMPDAETNQRVVVAVRSLPATLREVVVLHYLESLPIEEVAQAMNLKRSVVDLRLHRARNRLSELLKNIDEEDSSP